MLEGNEFTEPEGPPVLSDAQRLVSETSSRYESIVIASLPPPPCACISSLVGKTFWFVEGMGAKSHRARSVSWQLRQRESP